MTKKILLLSAFILLLICSNLLGDERYIEILFYPDGPVAECEIWFNTLTHSDIYIVKWGETCNGDDIAYIVTPSTPVYYLDNFPEEIVVDTRNIFVGYYDEEWEEVLPLDDEEWSDEELNQVWGQGYLVGPYSQYWYVNGGKNIQQSYAFLELSGMGDPPWYDYVYYNTNLSSEGWNWVSFPVMDPDFPNPIQHVLAPIADPNILDRVQGEVNGVVVEIYWDEYGGEWIVPPGMENFRSIDGYKIKMNNTADLEVAGWWEDPTTEIHLYEGQYNWVGYFLQESLSIRDAFATVWDNIITIQSKYWAIYRPWAQQQIRGTVNPGELYTVTVIEDCDLVWGTGASVEPYKKPKTDYYGYTETSDYEPILVDTVYGAEPEEIGVFVGDKCIGASKVDEYPVQILAYVEDDTTRYGDNELSFQLYNGIKNSTTQVNGVAVYDPVTFAFVDRPVYLNKDDFAVVRLNTEEAPEIPVEFSLYQNYPNPIRTSTTISFSTPEYTDNAEIEIYNVKGQLVKTLLPTTTHQSVLINVYWNGTDENGNQLSNGIYFYKLTSGEKNSI